MTLKGVLKMFVSLLKCQLQQLRCVSVCVCMCESECECVRDKQLTGISVKVRSDFLHTIIRGEEEMNSIGQTSIDSMLLISRLIPMWPTGLGIGQFDKGEGASTGAKSIKAPNSQPSRSLSLVSKKMLSKSSEIINTFCLRKKI